MRFYLGVQRGRATLKIGCLQSPKQSRINAIMIYFTFMEKKNTCSRSHARGMMVRLPFAKLLVLSATVAYSCSSGHFISLTWLHALVRRGLRIRFNWDYISIKTSSPLEREKAASNFRGGEGGRGERKGEGERIIDTGNARYLNARAAADKICMFANQEVSGVTCPPAPSANTRLRRLRRAKRASKQRNLWPRPVQIIAELESTPVRDPVGRLNRTVLAGAEHGASTNGTAGVVAA